jgi:hypothetical protein
MLFSPYFALNPKVMATKDDTKVRGAGRSAGDLQTQINQPE